ncbi:MAG TPA: ATP-binding protein [Solirubrobacteraceae bacterium]|nr:ATP-binding protein [Solirubrobacteraceae bacterium]
MTATGQDLTASAEDVRGLTGALEMQVTPFAESLDGLTFTFIAPVSFPLRAGGYVTVETPAGSRLGQIRELVIDRAEGPDITLSVGTFRDVHTRVPYDRLAGAGTMLAVSEPFHHAPFAPADGTVVQRWFGDARPRRAVLRIGQATLAPEVTVELDPAGFGRHTFLCGQSGSGKSYAMGLLLEQLLLHTDLPIVVLDPNSDATRLSELRSGADEVLAENWRSIARRIAVRGLGRDGEERLRLRFFDLDLATQEALLGLDPLRDREEFDAMREILEAEAAGQTPAELEERLLTGSDPRYRALALRIRNLGALEWPLWSRRADDRGLMADIESRDWRCLVVDLGSIALPAERALVSAAVLSKLWAMRAERRPVLLVIDEAHNVCPPYAEDALTQIALDHAVAIAGEGRKFGLHLLVATQRPLKVHENVLSQCDNLILMRMNSTGDLARIAELFSFAPPGLLARATTFDLGQALVSGRVASHPTFVTTSGRIAQEGGADVPADWARNQPSRQ